MAAVDVDRQLRQQVLLIGNCPGLTYLEAVVGVAYGQIGFQCGVLSLGQPAGVSNRHASLLFHGLAVSRQHSA